MANLCNRFYQQLLQTTLLEIMSFFTSLASSAVKEKANWYFSCEIPVLSINAGRWQETISLAKLAKRLSEDKAVSLLFYPWDKRSTPTAFPPETWKQGLACVCSLCHKSCIPKEGPCCKRGLQLSSQFHPDKNSGTTSRQAGECRSAVNTTLCTAIINMWVSSKERL